MKVAVTGAGGLVGSALVRRFGQRAMALSHGDLDITDSDSVHRIIRDLHPETIFNCVAVGVDECERDPDLAHRVNVEGPAYLAEAAHSIGAVIVHFSSNYVFDGEGKKTYTVADPPRPVNVYGRTKLEGEQAVLERCGRAFVVRTSWVFGPGKENFLSTAGRRLKHGERIRAITDTWASCTYVEDLVIRVSAMVTNGQFGTHHMVNDGVCSYETFAREAARILQIPDAAADQLIEPVSEMDMGRQARRPAYTPMECLPPLRRWQEALAAYLADSGR